jgi:hypothetical protein
MTTNMKPRLVRLADNYWECTVLRGDFVVVAHGATAYEAWYWVVYGKYQNNKAKNIKKKRGKK